MEKSNILVKIIISAAVLGVGIIIGYGLRTPPPPVNIPDIEKNAISKLEQQFNSKTKEGLIAFLGNPRIPTSLNGKIAAIDSQNNVIKIEAPNRYEGKNLFTYLNQPNYYTKTIKINEGTEIIRQEGKDMMQFMKEMGEYGKNGNKGSAPVFYKETKLLMEDLEKDMSISVESESEITLEGNDIIQAKKIIVNAPNK